MPFFRAESGGSTVEFTLWVPAFLGILLLGADASTAFTRQSNFWRISHETARIVSRHAMDEERGASFAREQLQLGSYTPEVEVLIDQDSQIVTVSVMANANEIAPFGIISLALGEQVSFSVSHVLEPY